MCSKSKRQQTSFVQRFIYLQLLLLNSINFFVSFMSFLIYFAIYMAIETKAPAKPAGTSTSGYALITSALD